MSYLCASNAEIHYRAHPFLVVYLQGEIRPLRLFLLYVPEEERISDDTFSQQALHLVDGTDVAVVVAHLVHQSFGFRHRHNLLTLLGS